MRSRSRSRSHHFMDEARSAPVRPRKKFTWKGVIRQTDKQRDKQTHIATTRPTRLRGWKLQQQKKHTHTKFIKIFKKKLERSKTQNLNSFSFYIFLWPNNAFIIVSPFEEISLRPELSSPPNFRIQGGVVWAWRTDKEGGRRFSSLILDTRQVHQRHCHCVGHQIM